MAQAQGPASMSRDGGRTEGTEGAPQCPFSPFLYSPCLSLKEWGQADSTGQVAGWTLKRSPLAACRAD